MSWVRLPFRKKTINRVILTSSTVVVSCVLALAIVAPAQATVAATLSFSPASPSLAAGEMALIEVNVTGVPSPGLAAFQFDLLFDPAVINVFDPNDGSGLSPFAPLGGNALCDAVRGVACPDPPWFLISTGRTPTSTVTIDNATGFVRIGYATSGVDAPPVGSGTIALLKVMAVTASAATLSLDNIILADNQEPPTALEAPPATDLAVNGGAPLLAGNVLLQGGSGPTTPRWSVPLDVTLTPAGGGPPSFSCTPMSDAVGGFRCSGFSPGDYVVCAKHSHTLQRCAAATLGMGSNTVDLGMLKEGDANDDNCVLLVDFSILVTTFAQCTGGGSFDPRADFDLSGCVLLVDFSLLASNFGTCGDAPPAGP